MRIRDTAFKRVLSRMQPGEKVLVEKLLESPQGSFALHEDASTPAVFIAANHPTFRLVVTMTVPREAQSWPGETGPIDRAMLEKYVGDLKSRSPKETQMQLNPIALAAALITAFATPGAFAQTAPQSPSREAVRSEAISSHKDGTMVHGEAAPAMPPAK